MLQAYNPIINLVLPSEANLTAVGTMCGSRGPTNTQYSIIIVSQTNSHNN